MNHLLRKGVSWFAAVVWVLVPLAARAAPSTETGRHMAAADHRALEQRVAEARRHKAVAFDRVVAVRHRLREPADRQHGRFPAVGLELKALGPEALEPLLGELVLADRDPALDDRLWLAWRVGVLEAVGELRDPGALPVLRAAIEGEEPREAARAAVEAYARFGSDAVARELVGLTQNKGTVRWATLAGMGKCRRLAVAEQLSRLLAARPDSEGALAIVGSLGDVGSAWVWKTPTIRVPAEEAKVRATAARALVSAFVAYGADVRPEVQRALLVVDDPSTPKLIATARAVASPALAAELDALAVRFAKNPIR